MNNNSSIKYKRGLFYSFLASSFIAILSFSILILPDISSKTVLDFIVGSLITIVAWVFWLGITTYIVMTTVGIPAFVILKKIKALSFINYVFVGTFFGYYLATYLIKPQITSSEYAFYYLCAFYGFACSAAFYIGFDEN